MAAPEVILSNLTIGKWKTENGKSVAIGCITFASTMSLDCHRFDGQLYNGQYSYNANHVVAEIKVFVNLRSGEIEVTPIKLEFADGFQSPAESGYSVVSVDILAGPNLLAGFPEKFEFPPPSPARPASARYDNL